MSTPQILEILARSHAESHLVYGVDVQTLVDVLQQFADETGIVGQIGQDAVQEIIAAPFAVVREEIEAEQAAEPDETDCNCGVAYTPKIVRAAEAIKANPLKSNRSIAEEVGVSEGTVRAARKATAQDYAVDSEPRVGLDGKQRRMPPQTTIDAFWHVVRVGDERQLIDWLAAHPIDAPQLHQLWREKCRTKAA